MRILLIDPGNGLDWAMRCIEAGHEIKWHLRQTEKTKHIGRGLVEIVDDWRQWGRWADLIVLTDNTYYLKEVNAWRDGRDARVIAATEEAAAWELDRVAGQEAFKAAGIATAEYQEFDSYDKAIAYVKKEGRRFVSKPWGGSEDKGLSYCAKSPADLVYMLERWKRTKKLKGAFILQEFVEGTEMAVGGWFGPGGFNEGWLENWEEKKQLNGDLGIATGEQGTTMRMVRRSRLADKVLKPLASQLDKVGYVGYVDVNCIIDAEGTPWPLEFTMRFGWPTFNIQQALHEGDPAEWLYGLAEGYDGRNWRMDEIAVGVVLTIGDYPYSHLTRKEVTGIPIYGMTHRYADQVHPCEVMAGEAPQDVAGKVVTAPCLVTAGDYVLIASGTGETVQTARGSAYRVLKRLSLPSSPGWRTDIGVRLKKQLPELQKHRYAIGMTYG